MIDALLITYLLWNAFILFRCSKLTVFKLTRRYTVAEAKLEGKGIRPTVLLVGALIGLALEHFGRGGWPAYHKWLQVHDHPRWLALGVVVAASLWLLKTITFSVMSQPHKYRWFDDGEPSSYTLDMKPAALWNFAFYLWIFLYPHLPTGKTLFRSI